MKESTKILSFFAERIRPRRYLEIGVRKCETLNEISRYVQEECVGVDPDPKALKYALHGIKVVTKRSDKYFEDLMKTDPKFDMIYIDGLHTKEQAERDFLNTCNLALAEEGWVFLHDTYPPDRRHTELDRCGTVWEFVLDLKRRIRPSDEWEFLTLPWAYGITCVRKFRGQVRFR